MNKYLVMIMGIILGAASLQAADLKNADSQKRAVKIDYGNGIELSYIHAPGYLYKNICSNCSVTIEGVKTDLSGGALAVIQGGKAILQE